MRRFWSKVADLLRGAAPAGVPEPPSRALPKPSGLYRIRARVIPSRPGRVYFHVTGPDGFRSSTWLPEQQARTLEGDAVAATVLAKIGRK